MEFAKLQESISSGTHAVSPERVEKRRAEVVAAALQVFLENGFKRTNMQDVADAASMSRANLYLMFANKEALFEAVVDCLQDRLHGEIQEQIADLESIPEKIECACRVWALIGYDCYRQYPNCMDLFDLERPAVRREYDRFHAFLSDLFAAHQPGADVTPSADDKAHLLLSAVHGFKVMARDEEQLSDFIRMQVAVLTR